MRRLRYMYVWMGIWPGGRGLVHEVLVGIDVFLEGFSFIKV